MKKILLSFALVGVFGMFGCGGGGKKPTSQTNIVPMPTSYTSLKDLENITLNMKMHIRLTGDNIDKIVSFKTRYLESGESLVIEAPTSVYIGICSLMDYSTDYTYICMEKSTGSNFTTAYGININNNGAITGNIDSSLTGDIEELAYGLKYPANSDSWIDGYTSRTTNLNKKNKYYEKDIDTNNILDSLEEKLTKYKEDSYI